MPPSLIGLRITGVIGVWVNMVLGVRATEVTGFRVTDIGAKMGGTREQCSQKLFKLAENFQEDYENFH